MIKCDYNEAIFCKYRDCAHCGWNPSVSSERLKTLHFDAKKALRRVKTLATRRNDGRYTKGVSRRWHPVRAIHDGLHMELEFDTIADCAAGLDVDPKCIRLVLNGYQKTSKGWRFEDLKARQRDNKEVKENAKTVRR